MGASITFIEPALRDALQADGLARYEDFLGCDRGELVAAGGSCETRRLALDEGGAAREYYLKRYRYAAGRGRLRARMDKAEREARNYAYLRNVCGVDVPDVVCFGIRSRLWRRRDGFILTRGVARALPLDAHVANRWPRSGGGYSDLERRALFNAACDLLRKMHDNHFYHLDLQWRNILVKDTCRLYVLDSSKGGPRRSRVFQEHGRLRDLSSLAKEAIVRLSRTERMRWLRQYLGVGRLGEAQRMMIRAIERDRVLKDNSDR